MCEGTLTLVLLLVVGVTTTGVAASPRPSAPPPGDADYPLCVREACQCVEDTVTCDFVGQQAVYLGEHAVPPDAISLQLLGDGHLQVLSRSLGGRRRLRGFEASGWQNVTIEAGAMSGNVSEEVTVTIANGGAATLEPLSLQKTTGKGLVVILRNLVQAHIKGRAFSRLSTLRVDNVQELRLEPNAVRFETTETSLQTKVIINNTTIPDVPGDTFPSAVGDIDFTRCIIDRIDRAAFSALRYDRVYFADSTLRRILGGALSDRTLVIYLGIRRSTADLVHSGAIQAAVSHLDVDHSRLVDVAGAAINGTIARLEIKNSHIGHLHSEALQMRDWSNLTLEQNAIARMDRNAITAPVTKSQSLFRCAGNTFGDVQERALSLPLDGGGLEIEIEKNKFRTTCRCGMREFLGNFLDEGMALDADQFFNTSSCVVDAMLANCVPVLEEGDVAMADFERGACQGNGEDLSRCMASVVPLDQPTERPPQSDNDGQLDLNEADNDAEVRERTLMFLVFGAGLVGAASVAAASCFTWVMGRDPCCSLGSRLRQVRQLLIPPPSAGVVAAASISRLPVDEYERRHTDTAVTTLSDVELEGEDGLWAPCEDKSTQTMPEELTQELLQSLRAKLDDPEIYSEACVIIEHLYDLIKVEETAAASSASHENLYDVIAPRRRPGMPGVAVASVGTRAPSPGALPPAPARPAPALCEYAEPSDARVHLYCELPVNGTTAPSGRSRDPNPATRPLPSRPKL